MAQDQSIDRDHLEAGVLERGDVGLEIHHEIRIEQHTSGQQQRVSLDRHTQMGKDVGGPAGEGDGQARRRKRLGQLPDGAGIQNAVAEPLGRQENQDRFAPGRTQRPQRPDLDGALLGDDLDLVAPERPELVAQHVVAHDGRSAGGQHLPWLRARTRHINDEIPARPEDQVLGDRPAHRADQYDTIIRLAWRRARRSRISLRRNASP